MLPEEEAWDTGAGANQSAQEEFIWERVWIIGSGIPSPTAGKAFRGVEEEHPPLPRVQGEEGGVLGDQRPSLEREDHLPHHRSFGLISKECCTRIVPFWAENKSQPVFIECLTFNLGQKFHRLRGTLLPLGSYMG